MSEREEEGGRMDALCSSSWRIPVLCCGFVIISFGRASADSHFVSTWGRSHAWHIRWGRDRTRSAPSRHLQRGKEGERERRGEESREAGGGDRRKAEGGGGGYDYGCGYDCGGALGIVVNNHLPPTLLRHGQETFYKPSTLNHHPPWPRLA